jgi:hypothetical protein
MRTGILFQRLSMVCGGLVLLAGCMSAPPSSYAKLTSLSPLEANPQEIRVAVLATQDLVMRPGDAILDVYFKPDHGEKLSAKYALEIISGNASAPQLLTALKPGQTIYVLRLTSADTVSLRVLQGDVIKAKAAGMHGEGGFSLGFAHACWNGSFPRDGRPMPFDPWIQTQAGGEFIPVFTGIDVKDLLKIAKIEALPSCAEEEARTPSPAQ